MRAQSWEQSVQECGLLAPSYPHFLPVMPLGWEQGLRVRAASPCCCCCCTACKTCRALPLLWDCTVPHRMPPTVLHFWRTEPLLPADR